MRIPRLSSVALVLPALLLAACFGRDNEDKGNVKVAFGSDSTKEVPLGEGDVRITSTDGSFVMAVVGDTVRMHLSDSLRNSVKSDIDTSAANEGAFAAAIAKSVGTVVSGAMGFVIRVPVEDVQNLRYENGKLRFDVKGGGVKMNTTDKNGGNAEFNEDDARRFIEAVERRQRERGTAT